MMTSRWLAPLFLLPVLLAGVSACQGLPADVLYRCEPDLSCVPRGTVCGADGLCHPAGEVTPVVDAGPGTDAGIVDAGVADAGVNDAGASDGGAADAGASDAGATDAGATDSGVPDAGGADAGGPDAGADAGADDAGVVDGGPQDAGACVPAAFCPMSLECGYWDAGCGVELNCQRDCAAPLECGVDVPNVCALPHLCSRGWCWENPFPQGNTLLASWGADARHVWFAGRNSTVLGWNGERSQVAVLPLTVNEDLLGVHGSAANDVYVVGTDATMLHFDGAQWEAEGLSVTTTYAGTVFGVWAGGGGQAWAVGTNLILARDGTQPPGSRWHAETISAPPGEDFTAVWGFSPAELYAFTTTGKVYRRSAANFWAQETLPNLTAGVFGEAWGAEGTLLLGGAVGTGKDGLLRSRAVDGGWRSTTYTAMGPVTGLSGLSAADVWVVTAAQVLHYLDAGTPTLIPTANDAGYLDLTATGQHQAVIGGTAGVLGTFSPAGLFQRSGGDRRDVTTVCGPRPEALYAGVSSAATAAVLTRTPGDGGTRWVGNEVGLPLGSAFTSCFAQDELAWLPAAPGRGASKARGSTTFVVDFTAAPLTGAHYGGFGAPGGPYFFPRESGAHPFVDVSADGGLAATTAVTILPNNQGVPRAAFGLGSGDAVVVGTKGSTFSWLPDGGFSSVTNLSTFDLRAVHGAVRAAGGSLYVAVDAAGTIWSRADGGAFTPSTVSPQTDLTGVWVGARDVWGVGNRAQAGSRSVATLFHDDGATVRWVDLPLDTAQPLWGLAGDGGTTLFVGGANGALLRRDLP